ncbi:HXXEE domain-containing protein [Nonomuraea soli]|uniref:HXXEE domain-containing protein n=1 Tax=Nonomuraea soli TaxID=1032476 RepID=A0A7W0HN35_9ACTN|nr:HXXEE domain-containing protein [Nonomuraea soli]MBA2889389.1 hypothetical protein [Nonomuraea soli]
MSPWGLLVAWAVHDAEELATMAGWVERERPRLERMYPWIRWDLLRVSQRHVTIAIGLMGLVMTAACAAGPRSRLFQTALAGFGLHGVIHLAQGLLTRGYTPGLLTAATVVLPYSVWAWRRLRAEGVQVSGGRSALSGVALFLVAVGGVHGIAKLLSTPPADRWF